MKNSLYFVFLFLFPIIVFSQKEAAIWYFGEGAGLDFNSGSPLALTDGQLSTLEGCSTISDSNGSLLFYTDGITVWNRNHQIMSNGTGLKGDPSSTQSGLIVPHPGDPALFFIFTADRHKRSNGINYSIVDITRDGGLGAIIQKNIQLLTPATEKLTAVAHANGTDIWLLVHGANDNLFYAYHISVTGVDHTPVTSAVGLDLSNVPVPSISHSLGYFKISPDGTTAIIVHFQLGVELLDFDSNTGIFSNPVTLWESLSEPFYGAEFSPSSKLVYITSSYGELYQYDASAPNVKATEILLGTEYSANGALQLAIDGKIYIADYSAPTLSVIENPDVLGAGANINYHAIDLAGKNSTFGLPPFIQSYFLSDEIETTESCHGDSTEFMISSNRALTSIAWDFGDGNTSSLENPSHIYPLPGTYQVSATLTRGTHTKTVTKEVTIHDAPVANTVSNFEVCAVSLPYEFDLSTKTSVIFGGQSATDFDLVYFGNLEDAQTGTNPLPNFYISGNSKETVFARISNRASPDCYDTTSFDLVVKRGPELFGPTDWTVCDIDGDGLNDFDLTQKDSEILHGQSPSIFRIRYFETQADADTGSNPIGPAYLNSSPRQLIFFRIENATSPECFETGTFNLEVIEAVQANDPSDTEVCDVDNDGVAIFNLGEKDIEILGAQNAFNFSVSYHISQADADNGSNTLAKSGYSNESPYRETIYARVANNADGNCYDTVSFSLRIYDAAVPQPVENWQVCDDDNDGIQTFGLTQKTPEILGGQSTSQFTVSYHATEADALANQNGINGPFQNVTNPQTIFYRVENNLNSACFFIDSFTLEVFDLPTANRPSGFIACDNNETGAGTFDLYIKDAEILKGQDPNVYSINYYKNQVDADTNYNALPKTSYTNTELQETIYARIQNTGNEDCYDLTSFELIVNPHPKPELEETYVICPDSPELTIDGGDFETWSWKNSNGQKVSGARILVVTALGEYSLTVSKTTNGVACEKTVNFQVVSSGAPEDFTTEIGSPSDKVTITVNATGIGEFEYSTDGENFQDSNRLDVFPGVHTVYVRDKFLCRTINREVIALGYQKFFTPNNDGLHENWNIIGATNYPGSQLYIYDRYGKLLGQFSPMGPGWDGTYNGSRLPSSDYWFRYVFSEGKVFTGHFSLKR